MNLETIKDYAHKILKIKVTNNNIESIYPNVILKVTIETLDNEVIRFSQDENENYINHQRYGDDYFISIENKSGESFIYAHFFVKELYEYDEPDTNLLYPYDLKKLKNTSNDTYKVSVSGDSIKVKSKLPNSITGDKNPNYKAYTKLNIDEPLSNETDSGHFPLTSRYRNNVYYSAPSVIQNPDPIWSKNNDSMPLWEVNIKRTDLSEFINNNESVNIYINYEYLPTSTEYHEHSFGLRDTEDDIVVFDSENIELVNDKFKDDKKKGHIYRLINYKNKFDNRHTVDVEHHRKINLDFNDPTIVDNSCTWEKNSCDKNEYYVYRAKKDTDTELYFDASLKANTTYILKYYMWIPSQTTTNDFYVAIKYYNELNQEKTLAKLNNTFIQEDKFLLRQWIYHEIPFTTINNDHKIIIKGPKTNNDVIFFTEFALEEQVPYSPTLKYTKNNVMLIEEDKYNIKNYDEALINTTSTTPTNTWGAKKELPTPHVNVYIDFNDEFYVQYNDKTDELTWHNTENYNITYNYDTNIFNFNTKTASYNDNNDELLLTFDYFRSFTYGLNNSFELKIYDDDMQPLDTGIVQCAITINSSYDGEKIEDEDMYLGEKNVKKGIVTYNRLNFRKLPKANNDSYYLRIDYINKCYTEDIHEYKKLHFEDEILVLTTDIIKDNSTTKTSINKQETYTVESADEFPLQINAYVKDTIGNTKYDGYCELSIDDEIIQTTFLNDNGIADFYLNAIDLPNEEQVIKIIYYERYNEPKLTTFFTIKNQYDAKPAVPISIHLLDYNTDTNGQVEQLYTNQTYKISDKDCLILDIDISDNRFFNYSVEAYITVNNQSTQLLQQDVYTPSEDSILLFDFYDENDTSKLHDYNSKIKYTIVTNSITGQNKYRRYKKVINVKWDKTN